MFVGVRYTVSDPKDLGGSRWQGSGQGPGPRAIPGKLPLLLSGHCPQGGVPEAPGGDHRGYPKWHLERSPPACAFRHPTLTELAWCQLVRNNDSRDQFRGAVDLEL